MDANLIKGFRQHPADSRAPTSHRPARLWRLVLLVTSVVLLLAAIAKAQPAGQSTDPMKAMSDGWGQLYAGDFAKTVKTIEPLLTWPEAHVRTEAQHLAARAMLAGGNRQAKDKAVGIWKALERSRASYAGYDPLSDPTGRRVAIGQALQLAVDGKQAEAIKRLEPFLNINKRFSDPAICEGALLLAELYGQEAKRFDDADKALQFAEDYIKVQLAPGGELNERITAPFSAEVKAARRRLAAIKQDVLFPGKTLFDKAEQLRAAKKFAEAAKVYQEVVSKFPNALYACRSNYCLGLCAIGLDRPADAVKIWEQFLASKPEGGYRAQAALGIIDTSLEEFVDIDKADACGKKALASLQTVAGSSPLSELDKQIKESWQVASADLHLRLGLLALLKNDHLAAGDAFAKARTAAVANKLNSMLAGLDVLIEAAKEKQPLLPADVAGTTAAGPGRAGGKTPLALSMVRIFDLTGRRPKAEAFLDDVLAGKWRDRTTAQLAFAFFLKGRMVQSRGLTATWAPPAAPGAENKPSPLSARDLYALSIKTFKDGSWHAETLYAWADLEEADARRQFGPLPPPAPKKDKDGNVIPEPAKSAEQIKKEKAAQQERELKWLQARSASLPIWKELIDRYTTKGEDGKLTPTSPRVEDAAFRAGLLLADLEQWKDAVATLDRAVKMFPASQYAGGALVRLIDIELEELFSLPPAREYATAAVAWANTFTGKPTGAAADGAASAEAAPVVALFSAKLPPLDAATLKNIKYQVYLRTGLIAYLGQDFAKASTMFETARPLTPPRGYTVVGQVPTGVEQMIAVAKQGKALTPAQVLAGNEKIQLILQLVDIYHEVNEYNRSLALCEIALSQAASMTDEQRSWAMFKRARNRFCQDWKDRDPIAAMQDYVQAQKLAPQSPWAYRCLFYAGNIMFTRKHDRSVAIALWSRLLKDYPDCPEAPRAAYYIALAYEHDGLQKEARKAFEDYLKQYPSSPFVELVQQYHLANINDRERLLRPGSTK